MKINEFVKNHFVILSTISISPGYWIRFSNILLSYKTSSIILLSYKASRIIVLSYKASSIIFLSYKASSIIFLD